MKPLRLTTDMAPEDERIAPEQRISGDPLTRTFSAWDQDGIACGTWTSEVGAWRIDYDVWEYVRMLEGRCAVEAEDGSRSEYGPGDSFIIPKGFRGVWETLAPLRKEYVIVG